MCRSPYDSALGTTVTVLKPKFLNRESFNWPTNVTMPFVFTSVGHSMASPGLQAVLLLLSGSTCN